LGRGKIEQNRVKIGFLLEKGQKSEKNVFFSVFGSKKSYITPILPTPKKAILSKIVQKPPLRPCF
jgi:hypothetical protein